MDRGEENGDAIINCVGKFNDDSVFFLECGCWFFPLHVRRDTVSIVDLSLSLAMLTCLKKEVNLHPEVYSFLGWMYPNILTDCCPSRFSLTTTILNNLLIFCGGFMYISWTSYLFLARSECTFWWVNRFSFRIHWVHRGSIFQEWWIWFRFWRQSAVDRDHSIGKLDF